MNIFLQQKSSYNRPADSSVGLFILPTTNCLQHFQTDLPTENSYRNCLQDFPTTSRGYVRSRLCIRVSFSRCRLGRLGGRLSDAFAGVVFVALTVRPSSVLSCRAFCRGCALRVLFCVASLSRCAFALRVLVSWCRWYLYRGKPFKMLVARYFVSIVKNLTSGEQKKNRLGLSPLAVWFIKAL